MGLVYKARVTLHPVRIAGASSQIGKKRYGTYNSLDELIATLSSPTEVAGLPERWPVVLKQGYSTAGQFESANQQGGSGNNPVNDDGQSDDDDIESTSL